MTAAFNPASFYPSRAWKQLRLLALQRDHWRCTVCGIHVGGKAKASVDHILPARQRPDLAMSLANLRTLCRMHDNQSHREKWRGDPTAPREARFTGCNPDGTPLDPGHHWRQPNATPSTSRLTRPAPQLSTSTSRRGANGGENTSLRPVTP